MRTGLDAPNESLEQDEQVFVAKVREHGWLRTSVLEDDSGPGFSYTTGFFVSNRQPELIIFGMKHEIAHDIFWDLYREGKANRSLPAAMRTNAVFANLPAYVFSVAKRFYSDYLGWSRWFYGGDAFPCLQIVWPDREGVFPWEDGFNTDLYDLQPDLTETGWKTAVTN